MKTVEMRNNGRFISHHGNGVDVYYDSRHRIIKSRVAGGLLGDARDGANAGGRMASADVGNLRPRRTAHGDRIPGGTNHANNRLFHRALRRGLVRRCRARTGKGGGRRLMTSDEYYAGEFTDDFLGALADAGDFLNEEEGVYDQLSDAQLERMAAYGDRLNDLEQFRRWMNKPPYWKGEARAARSEATASASGVPALRDDCGALADTRHAHPASLCRRAYWRAAPMRNICARLRRVLSWMST